MRSMDVSNEYEVLPIPGHSGYYARADGAIIGKRGKAMNGHIDRCGYHQVLLYENGKTKNAQVHRLMLMAFKPTKNMDSLQANHINGMKSDNRIQNLEWCTRSENLHHAYDTGLEKKMTGTKHHRHIFDQAAINDIRTHCRLNSHDGNSAASFARKYGCHYYTIIRLVKGITYAED